MMVDMEIVAWLSKGQINKETDELLNQWAIFTEQEVKPPIHVEAIAEKYLEFTLEYDNLDEILGIPDVLGATWAKEKRMVINNSLLDGVEGRITFTCGHEIGHWILHRRYLSDQSMRLHDLSDSDQPNVVCRMSASKLRGEWQADYFSSCLLMPQAEVEDAYKRVFGTTPVFIYNEKSCFGRNNPVVIDPALDTAKEIAQKVIIEGNFTNVSKEAMCYRLNDLGLLINLTGKSLVGQFKGIKPSVNQNRC
jgi:Zn-dependent peptidase ImmA (M78 family)